MIWVRRLQFPRVSGVSLIAPYLRRSLRAYTRRMSLWTQLANVAQRAFEEGDEPGREVC